MFGACTAHDKIPFFLMHFASFFRATSEDGFLIETLTIMASFWGRFREPEASQAESRMGPETRTSLKGDCPQGGTGGGGPTQNRVGLGGWLPELSLRRESLFLASRRSGSHPEAFG